MKVQQKQQQQQQHSKLPSNFYASCGTHVDAIQAEMQRPIAKAVQRRQLRN